MQFYEGVIVIFSVRVGQLLDVIRQQGPVLTIINLFHLCKYTFRCNDQIMFLLGPSTVSESVHFPGYTEGTG